MIGWGAAQHGVEFSCVRPDAHKNGGSGRRTHGIDYLLPCKSPLAESLGQNLVVSVKFSAQGYPTNPRGLFKEHFTDLAQTLECFRNSQIRSTISIGTRGVTKGEDIGVLLWINNDRKGKPDVIEEVSGVSLPDTLKYQAIYLVDNRRAEFIFDSINYAKHVEKGCEVSFFYHDTGKSFNPQFKLNCGPLLPVEYVNSNVLALRIEDPVSLKRALMLSTVENFSESGLKRLLGMAQQLSQGWCSKVILAFPDYSRLEHENTVQASRACFSDAKFAGGAEVHCYDRDFRAMGG